MEHAVIDPISLEVMADPVICDGGRKYDRFSAITALIRSPGGFNGEAGVVTRILFDDISLRDIIFERYPEQQQEFKKRREEFRASVEKALAQNNLREAAVKLPFLRQFDKNPVPGEERLEILSQIEKIKTLRTTPEPERPNVSSELSRCLFDVIRFVKRNQANANLIELVEPEFGMNFMRSWTLDVFMGFFIVSTMTEPYLYNVFPLNYPKFQRYIVTNVAKLERKQLLLEHILYILQRSKSDWNLRLHGLQLWFAYKDNPDLKIIADKTYSFFVTHDCSGFMDVRTFAMLARHKHTDSRCRAILDKIILSDCSFTRDLEEAAHYLNTHDPRKQVKKPVLEETPPPKKPRLRPRK
jgi:hypothetical protein